MAYKIGAAMLIVGTVVLGVVLGQSIRKACGATPVGFTNENCPTHRTCCVKGIPECFCCQ